MKNAVRLQVYLVKTCYAHVLLLKAYPKILMFFYVFLNLVEKEYIPDHFWGLLKC